MNPAEREVLALLAQGHTAKSIATLTGKTEGSVNERLREARRKTGAASSRELARLFAEDTSRKNRDEQTGVADPASGGSGSPTNTARRPRGASGKGIIVMGVITGMATLAGMLFAIQPAPQAAAPAEDLVLGSLATRPAPSLVELHQRMRGEGRDENWATAKEAAIRAKFTTRAGLGQAGDLLRVICGKTLCEVAVTMPDSSEKRIQSAMEGIQGKELRDSMDALGLVNEIMSFGSADDQPARSLFVSYWRRK